MSLPDWVMAVVALGIAIFLLTPWLVERFRTPMDVEEARVKAPGEFATLPSGVTHYRWFGPENGPVIVCVHGLSTPSFGYVGLATALSMKGWRVLTYDLYGRGYSDNVPGTQDIDFFLTQLDELLEHQDVTGRFTIFGYSMGGLIATAYTERSPQRINQMMLIASAGVAPLLKATAGLAKVRSIPLLNRWLGIVFGGRALRKYINDEIGADPVRQRQIEQTHRRGYWPALMSSQQHALTMDFEQKHRKIAELEVPVLAIWARNDQVIPIEALGHLAQWNRAARQEILEDAQHGLTYSHPKEIAEFFLGNI